ncbi:hypothetical protein BSZ39_12215 [Bowdeniella nasicola]|uniref:MT0933-like antitoxin protein n=1 Tax=Bowdeniella nasicola TaxID=208480 RepID=A0A1Q5PZH3_9ACTO|nr:antitoxin [Bowdeniella nasicola]OKL52937.1 hypothetical protein BSZ39_12215 [Bowdeniella nasicola]
MGLGHFVNKAKEQLNSEKAEQLSDSALDKAKDFASQRTGGKYYDKITSARDSIDERIGTEGTTPAEDPSTDQVNDPAEAKPRLDSDQQL